MVSQTCLETEELIDSLGRFRQGVLPVGVMRELLSRGAEVAPTLLQHLMDALAPHEGGLEPHGEEAFFCFHLLGGTLSPSSVPPSREFIGQLLRRDDRTIDMCAGGSLTENFFRALITSLADKDDLPSFCKWIDSLVQDDQVNEYGKQPAAYSLFSLVGEGVLQDAEALRWIRKWLDDRKDIRHDLFSSTIVADFPEVGGEDLKELATACFNREQIDDSYVHIDCLDEMSDDRQADFLRKRAEADRQLLSDPISYLEPWGSFSWSTDSLDPQATAIDPITKSFQWREKKPDAKEVDQWLAQIDSSTYDTYPRRAIKEASYFVGHTIEQLKDRVRRGTEWAQQGKSFSSNAPYLAALILAMYGHRRSIALTDPDPFLAILDLTSDQRLEWFGDSIDPHIVAALATVLAGKIEPISQRLSDSSRDQTDRALLVDFFPASVYHGFLSRDRCIEILREIWATSLRENEMESGDCPGVLGALYDAFCMLSIAEDDPVMREAEEADIGNLFMDPMLAAAFRSEPSNTRDYVDSRVYRPNRLKEAIEAGLQFSSNAINPPPANPPSQRVAAPSSESQNPPLESQGTIRNNSPKAGRNSPCTCGSGKKFKKCCGRK